MNGILDKLQNVLVPFSQKVNENKVLRESVKVLQACCQSSWLVLFSLYLHH